MTVRDGRRCSAADAYLRPGAAAQQSDVEVGALATRTHPRRQARAAGVEYMSTARR